jgi:hypothetical protein
VQVATAVRAPDAVPHPGASADPTDGGERRPDRHVLRYALALIALQLVVRGWVAATGYLSQDDLVFESRAAGLPLLSSDFLLYDHDGHFMPAAWLLIGLVTDWWPLQWWPLAVLLVLMQAVASLAVLRLLRLLLGDRPAMLVPLVFFLFSPLTVPAFAWWAPAVNLLPLQAGLAWIAAEAVLLTRTGRTRHAVRGTAAFALAVAFFEKSIVIAVFAAAVAYLVARADGQPAPLRRVLGAGRPLWTGMLAVLAVWFWAYSTHVESPLMDPVTGADAARSIGRGLSQGLLTAAVGGPWEWVRPEGTGVPLVHPPVFLTVASGVVALLVVVLSSLRRRGAWLAWLMVVGYVGANVVAMVLARFNASLADVVPLTLRYYTDATVVITAAIALVLLAPPRGRRPARPLLTPHGRRVVLPATGALFVASSLVSTLTFSQIWSDSRTETYLATARASLAESWEVPLLDQAIPEDILWGAAHPNNLASRIFLPFERGPAFSTSTPALRMIADSGEVVDAVLSERQTVAPGPIADCGHIVTGEAVTVAPLEGSLFAWEWTLRLDYFANRDGVVQVAMSTGEGVRVPLARGPHTVFVRLVGGGDDLRLHSMTDDLSLCVVAGAVGMVEPAPTD